jgi:polynucleotide 5'-kinase involved in rRNA processing
MNYNIIYCKNINPIKQDPFKIIIDKQKQSLTNIIYYKEYQKDIINQLVSCPPPSSPSSPTSPSPSIMISGNKNTGKSNICIYLINSLLSINPSVLFLDLDLGQ